MRRGPHILKSPRKTLVTTNYRTYNGGLYPHHVPVCCRRCREPSTSGLSRPIRVADVLAKASGEALHPVEEARPLLLGLVAPAGVGILSRVARGIGTFLAAIASRGGVHHVLRDPLVVTSTSLVMILLHAGNSSTDVFLCLQNSQLGLLAAMGFSLSLCTIHTSRYQQPQWGSQDSCGRSLLFGQRKGEIERFGSTLWPMAKWTEAYLLCIMHARRSSLFVLFDWRSPTRRR